MKAMSKVARILAFLTVAMMIGSMAVSAAAPRVVLKFAHVMATDHAYHLMAEKFKEEL